MLLLKKLAVIDMGDFDYSTYTHREMMNLVLNNVQKRNNMIFVFFYEAEGSKPNRIEVCLMVDPSIYKVLEELFHQKIDENNEELIDLTVENMERNVFFETLRQKFEMEINTCEIST